MTVLVLDPGRQVGRHAGHAVGAERLDAGALHGLEHDLGGARPGCEPGVQLGIVARGRQRQAVGPAADHRHFPGGGDAGGLRQLDRLAVDLRLAGSVADLHLVVAGDGAHGKPQHPLEGLGRAFLVLDLRHALHL